MRLKYLYFFKITSLISLLFSVMICVVPFHFPITGTYIAFLLAVAVCFFISLFLTNRLPQPDYYLNITWFKREIGLLAASFFISVLEGRFYAFADIAASYIFIYLVAMIIQLRTLRYLNYNKESKALNRINFRYAAIVITLSIILSTSTIREPILYIIYNIVFLLLYLIVWILYSILHYPIESLINLINQFSKNIVIKDKPLINPGNFKGIFEKGLTLPFHSGGLFGIILQAAAVVVILLILIKIVHKVIKRPRSAGNKDDVAESRAFISSIGKGDRMRPLRQKTVAPLPHGSIRYYYRKFIGFCSGMGIHIAKSDTTFEISKKYQAAASKNSPVDFRNIYLKVR